MWSGQGVVGYHRKRNKGAQVSKRIAFAPCSVPSLLNENEMHPLWALLRYLEMHESFLRWCMMTWLHGAFQAEHAQDAPSGAKLGGAGELEGTG